MLEGVTITISSVRSKTRSLGDTTIRRVLSDCFSILHQDGAEDTFQLALDSTEILSSVPFAGKERLFAPTSKYSGRASCTTLIVLYKEPILTVKFATFSRVLLFTSRH